MNWYPVQGVFTHHTMCSQDSVLAIDQDADTEDAWILCKASCVSKYLKWYHLLVHRIDHNI